MFPYNNSHLIN